MLILNPDTREYYTGIAGADRCTKKRCDLSNGIVIAGRSITFHLVAPDSDFLYKLALPFAVAVPPESPSHDVGTHPIPATGPYNIARYRPHRELVFVRNPFFREWSRAARPDGYPDRIVWRLDQPAAAATRAVEDGRADVAYDFVPSKLLGEVRAQFASQLHIDPIPGTYFTSSTRGSRRSTTSAYAGPSTTQSTATR